MATTTNFGWETPDDTDLVKDGALAMRTLGNAIDTSLVDLKGGTTGQVLSKTSNTDMDFTWVTSDDANAIQNTIVDAKGDLITATAADTPARLAVGSNGDTLVADSAASTGLRWSSGTNLDNPIINSSMQIWQRGTTSADSAGSPYTADRWQLSRSSTSGATVTRQATGDTTNLPSIQYCARVQRNSGNTSTNLFYFTQTIETANSIPFAGKSLTVSFYARAGANYSAASSILKVELITGTGSDQNVVTGLTSQTVIGTTNATLTTTWQRFSFTATMGATATQLAFATTTAPVGTAGAADYFEITGVQIDVGSVALPFRTSTGTLQGELAACQRYLPAISGLNNSFQGMATSTTQVYAPVIFAVTPRVAPTGITVSSAGHFILINGSATAGTGVSTVAFDSAGTTSATIGATTTAGNPTIAANQPAFIRSNNASALILFTGCEL
jgi:hypothetical protein